MRVLVTGASGFIGSYVMRDCPESYCPIPLSRAQTEKGVTADLLSLNEKDLLDLIKKQQIDGIIHLAAEGNVSVCERSTEAYRLNVGVTKNLVAAAKQRNLPIIFSSTDQVFSGEEGLLCESTAPSPCHQYGQQKREAEHIVLGYTKGLVLRLPLVLGLHKEGKGSLEAMLNHGRQHGALNMFIDEFRRPVHAIDVARALWAALGWKPGIYHISGPKLMSRMEIAKEITSALNEYTIQLLPTPQKEQMFGYKRPSRLDLVSNKSEVEGLGIPSVLKNIHEIA
ncbi:MAG: SDR family oxidoreductase [Bacteroidota bacterium]|nr:SDR family oxidoreductase [Bacteroidota bacterium]